MARLEQRGGPQVLGMPRIEGSLKLKEVIQPSEVNVMLIGMQGEGGFSMHDPIGLGVITKRIHTDHPTVEVEQYDIQPQLSRTGKIDTDLLAEQMHEYVTRPESDKNTTIIGFGVPIYSVNYLQSTLIKYEQLCEEEPPKGKVEIVLGGAIPTHTDSELLREMFPNVKLVKGEGEERMSAMVAQALRGEEITESTSNFEWANLQDYAGSDRTLTVDTLGHGGMPKLEASRGCGFGACSFCSRDLLGGVL